MNEHKLMQYLPGTRGAGQGRRRKTTCCRACPNKSEDGTRNHRETSFYCSACETGFHPECFAHFKCWENPVRGKRSSPDSDNEDGDAAAAKQQKKKQKTKASVPQVVPSFNGHLLMQHLPGTRGPSQGLRRKTSCCRGCKSFNEDGSKNNRDTSYYCTKCMVGFHPQCFGLFKCWEKDGDAVVPAAPAEPPIPVAAQTALVPKARKLPIQAEKKKAKTTKPVKVAKAAPIPAKVAKATAKPVNVAKAAAKPAKAAAKPAKSAEPAAAAPTGKASKAKGKMFI